jgi:excisionase family DNA binding protein
MKPPPQMMTVTEVAELFQVSRGTIFRWSYSGKLISVRPMNGKRLFPANQPAIQARRRLMDHGQTTAS